MGLVLSIDEITEYLGETSGTYDDFLTSQEAMLAESIEGYCGRKFNQGTYTQTFYKEDYPDGAVNLLLFHYPLISVTSVVENSEDIKSNLRIHKPTGNLMNPDGFFVKDTKVIVTYVAGFASAPLPVKNVLLALLEERYNKKKSGVGLNFGSDVQSISIPGTISVAFDYSLQSNERKSAFGTFLGNYINVLDAYRSERRVVGSGTIAYVD